MRLTYMSASGQLGGAETALLDVIAAVRETKPSWPVHVVIAAIEARRDLAIVGVVLRNVRVE